MTKPSSLSDTSTRFSPKTPGQKRLVASIWNNPITVVAGPAGTGKTCLSIQTLLEHLKTRKLEKIVCVRLAVDTNDEHLGALPGEFRDKMAPFMGPIVDNLAQMCTGTELRYYIENKCIETLPVSYLRGRTFLNTGILVEESQNMTEEMIITILTRMGSGSKVVINGDPQQVDVEGRNGILYAARLLEGIQGVDVIHLTDEDIQRHPLLREILRRAEALKAA
jgi:phosphate starvation-inducible PhoH-like protein